jgi:hypothetical protein
LSATSANSVSIYFNIFHFVTSISLIMKLFQSISAILAAISLLSTCCSAQLSGSVGPTTTTAQKAAKKICNVLNYGAKADKTTDLGPPLASAFAACKTGGIGESL